MSKPTTTLPPHKLSPKTEPPQIPQLPGKKKHQKERKKSGAYWNGVEPAGSAFRGVSGGSSCAANVMTRLASGAAEVVEVAAVAAPGAGGAVAYQAAGSFRVVCLILAAAGGLLAGRIMVGGGLPSWMSFAGAEALARYAGILSPINSTIKPRKAGESASLYYAGRAAKGELKFAQPFGAPKADPVGAGADVKEGEKVADGAKVGDGQKIGDGQQIGDGGKVDWGSVLAQAGVPTLPHNMAAARLSTNLGGSTFGGKSIFGGSSGAPQFGTSLGNLGLPSLSARASLGKIGAFSRFSIPTKSGPMSQMKGLSPRAMGQLKLARTLSTTAGATQASEPAKLVAGDAFDQSITMTANPPQSPMDVAVDPKPVPLGGGAPDITQPTDGVNGTNVTPWQGAFDNAQQQAKQAGSNKLMSIMLLIAGIILCVAAYAAWSCLCVAIPLLIAGIMLIMQGIMKLTQSQQNAAAANQGANQIAAQPNGQTVQANILHECANSAAATGNCTTQTTAPDMKSNIKPAADAESNSSYELQSGQPLP